MRDLFSRITFVFNFPEVTKITTGVIKFPYGEGTSFPEIDDGIFNRHIKCFFISGFDYFSAKAGCPLMSYYSFFTWEIIF